MTGEEVELARRKEDLFVQLFVVAKQIVDSYPNRFPDLEYSVRVIERKGLAPKLDVEFP